MKPSLIVTVIATTLSLGAADAAASDSKTYKKEYRKVLRSELSHSEPGAAALISKDGDVIFKKAIGRANLELNVPLKAKSVFKIGSITKQFTAAAIMILQERGKLSVTDDIHKYVPNFPTDGHVVTIEHLLTHTSGIANYTEDRELMLKEATAPATLDEILTRVAQHPMKFQPGDGMAYSNTGYLLLGKIIEVASGQSYAEFIDEHIFQKLDMKNSHYAGRKVIKNHVSGYDATSNGYITPVHVDTSWPHAAGALSSNVFDLNTWFYALANEQLISEQSYQQMLAPVTLNDGRISNYGYGIAVTTLGDYQVITHNGGINGFVSDALYVPEEALYVAVLSNNTNISPLVLSQRLAAKALDINIPSFKEVSLSDEQLRAFAGEYRLQNGAVYTVAYYQGDLYFLQEGWGYQELYAMSPNSFFFEDSNIYLTFTQNSDGQAILNQYVNFSSTPIQAIKQ
ncbi:serine hydrolase domain-containing protein [Pseudoalteromonas obscura]|uniref:Serine hydrolase domain-containing protein n=1 Tax=Pseudoalteromonas obscura TaxID=3048491 RepID=A0ABT7EL63_9GAMM|nr:serine hydrolase domain-containing protein [Pseudoalteromonas sp. P94(2023)]MDK2595785.1 serine hydrolase domain-containing protein [Pseudoalteromonas sp. P94(2023)]